MFDVIFFVLFALKGLKLLLIAHTTKKGALLNQSHYHCLSRTLKRMSARQRQKITCEIIVIIDR